MAQWIAFLAAAFSKSHTCHLSGKPHNIGRFLHSGLSSFWCGYEALEATCAYDETELFHFVFYCNEREGCFVVKGGEWHFDLQPILNKAV